MYGDVTDTGAGIFNDDGSYEDYDSSKLTTTPASVASTYTQMYNLVKAIKGVMSEGSTKTTRYGDPEAIAEQYEAYGRGLQDYVLSKIESGAVKRKTVAVVSDVDTEANTVTLYKSSPSNSIFGYGSSFGGGYKHMEAVENVADNIAGIWSKDDEASTKAKTTVITDVSELTKADAIILAWSSDQSGLQTVFEAAGIKEADQPAIFANYASSTSRSIPGFPMLQTDGLEMMASEIGFLYPEVLNPAYAMAYYYTQFYHVKNDTTTLSNVLSYNIKNMSLPTGVTADLSGYSDSVIQSAIDEGLSYYVANKATIDATYPKLTPTSNLTLPSDEPDIDNPDASELAQTIKISPTSKAFKVAKVKVQAKKSDSYKASNTKTITVKVK